MKKKASNRQLEIIEAAARLLMESGIKGLTTKNLASQVGFSESALYRHFKNKEDIVVLLLEYLASNIIERLEKFQFEEKNSIEKLKNIFSSQFNYFSENPHFIVAILSEGLFDETENIYQSMMKIISFKTQLLTNIIERGKAKNELTDEISTSDIVHIVMGSFRLMMLKWKLSKFETDLITEGNKIIESNLKLIQI